MSSLSFSFVCSLVSDGMIVKERACVHVCVQFLY